jgi:hypothetical protein
MQLWSSHSEYSMSTSAPPQAKTTADMMNVQQDLSQQLMAFHQQQKQKQAHRQAAATGTAVLPEQMLEQFYQQRAMPVMREHEPASRELYSQAMAHASHASSQHMTNQAYARQPSKALHQVWIQKFIRFEPSE